jgi:hypothetical protein
VNELSYKTAVAELQQSPYFKAIVLKVASLAPVIPSYDYMGASNIEEIKFKLAQRTMHELVMSILSPKGKVE